MEMLCIVFELGTEFLNIILMKFRVQRVNLHYTICLCGVLRYGGNFTVTILSFWYLYFPLLKRKHDIELQLMYFLPSLIFCSYFSVVSLFWSTKTCCSLVLNSGTTFCQLELQEGCSRCCPQAPSDLVAALCERKRENQRWTEQFIVNPV
jgi:hypothetical protein